MDICRDADDLGIQYLTIYAFSTENWQRAQSEVRALMALFVTYLDIFHREALENHMCVRVIGDTSVLSSDLREKIRILEDDTKKFDGFHLQIAINYGSRDEMLRAMKKVLREHDAGSLPAEDLTEERYAEFLDTAGIPDPDLMIRTSGEMRLSNYLMWQHAYSEFYFTDTLWPDFNKAELIKALEDYTKRDRRYGKAEEE